MSSIDAKWPGTPSAICKWHTLTDWQNSLETFSRFFENYPNEICSHLCEKASKGTFLKSEILQNHSNEGKGKDKRKERGEGKEEKNKKAMVALLVFIKATLKIVFGRKNCFTQKVYLAIMLSNIRIDDPTRWAALIPNGLKPNSSIFAQIFELKYNKICAGWKSHCPLLETFCDAFIYFFSLFFLYERQQCNDPFHHFIFHFRLRFRFRFRILDRPWANNLTEHGFGVKYDDMKLRYFRKRFTMVRSSF